MFGTDRFMLDAAAAEDVRLKDPLRSTGTLAQQNRAKAIVRSSGAYEKLVADQVERVGFSARNGDASFDLDQAIVNVEGPYASVVTVSLNRRRSIAAAFIVDLSEGSVDNVRTVEATPADGGRAASVVTQENFRDAEKFARVVFGRDHASVEGRRMSYRAFRKAPNFLRGLTE
ncbi:hypothetical protein [Rubrobacter xylanophilus]|uniref:hypothetical protein n=1 Tax=Rubrobacter xylanophilus TaxID=49319 RepID=UPI001C63E4E2|nr:hypothetical protein [Rubrobacter xylanophilus]